MFEKKFNLNRYKFYFYINKLHLGSYFLASGTYTFSWNPKMLHHYDFGSIYFDCLKISSCSDSGEEHLQFDSHITHSLRATRESLSLHFRRRHTRRFFNDRIITDNAEH